MSIHGKGIIDVKFEVSLIFECTIPIQFSSVQQVSLEEVEC